MVLIRNERNEAHTELLEQARYYEQARQGLGYEFLAAVDEALDLVEAFPNAWAPVEGWDHEPVLRVKQIDGFPIGAIYLVRGDTLTIFAYAHHSRSPEYWRNRINPP